MVLVRVTPVAARATLPSHFEIALRPVNDALLPLIVTPPLFKVNVLTELPVPSSFNMSPEPVSVSTIAVLAFLFNDTATTEIYTLSLHYALPIFVPVTAPSNLP